MASFLDRFFGRGREEEQPGLDSLPVEEYFAGDEAWIPLASSYLHSVAYYGQGTMGVLAVRFIDPKTGGVRFACYYEGVPPHIYEGLLNAGSHGKYFHSSGLQRWPFKPL